MKTAILVVLAVTIAAGAEQIAVDPGFVPEKDSDRLQYDDGTAAWITWSGTFRGVWFNMNDFLPPGESVIILETEFWFYHHPDFPWDTSDFYAEVWTGGSSGPSSLLDQTQATAVHFAPVFACYASPPVCETEFWVLVNTELSEGGWPSILSDGTPGTHSFYSDDSIAWEPWGDWGDYFIRVGMAVTGSLSNTTWGELKTVF